MTDDIAPWRPELVAGLRLLARISEALHRRGLPRPILVGGAAVEYYTASALMTGDIEIEAQQALLAEEQACAPVLGTPSSSGTSHHRPSTGTTGRLAAASSTPCWSFARPDLTSPIRGLYRWSRGGIDSTSRARVKEDRCPHPCPTAGPHPAVGSG